MRLQCNGSWITYQHLSDGLQPGFRDTDMGCRRSASGFATGTHKCDYKLACEKVNISTL